MSEQSENEAAKPVCERAYRVRCYPTKPQARLLAQLFGARRYVWNWALAKTRGGLARAARAHRLRAALARAHELRAQPGLEWLGGSRPAAPRKRRRSMPFDTRPAAGSTTVSPACSSMTRSTPRSGLRGRSWTQWPQCFVRTTATKSCLCRHRRRTADESADPRLSRRQPPTAWVRSTRIQHPPARDARTQRSVLVHSRNNRVEPPRRTLFRFARKPKI